MEKYCRAGQAADDNMAHAHCMLVTLGYETLSGPAILVSFTLQNGYMKESRRSVPCALPLMFKIQIRADSKMAVSVFRINLETLSLSCLSEF